MTGACFKSLFSGPRLRTRHAPQPHRAGRRHRAGPRQLGSVESEAGVSPCQGASALASGSPAQAPSARHARESGRGRRGWRAHETGGRPAPESPPPSPRHAGVLTVGSRRPQRQEQRRWRQERRPWRLPLLAQTRETPRERRRGRDAAGETPRERRHAACGQGRSRRGRLGRGPAGPRRHEAARRGRRKQHTYTRAAQAAHTHTHRVGPGAGDCRYSRGACGPARRGPALTSRSPGPRRAGPGRD